MIQKRRVFNFVHVKYYALIYLYMRALIQQGINAFFVELIILKRQ